MYLTKLFYLGCSLGFLYIIDIFFASKTKHRWFCLHAIANSIITITSISGVIKSLEDPIHAMDSLNHFESSNIFAPASIVPICMINSIHIYHVMMFKLPRTDVFHHILFGIFIGVPGIYYHWGALRNFLSFGICGFPGMLDYTNLLLVKQQLLKKQQQKYFCSLINTWIRSPLICFEVFMHYIAYIYGTTTVPIAINFLVGFLAILNCQYYLDSSIRSEVKYILSIKKSGHYNSEMS